MIFTVDPLSKSPALSPFLFTVKVTTSSIQLPLLPITPQMDALLFPHLPVEYAPPRPLATDPLSHANPQAFSQNAFYSPPENFIHPDQWVNSVMPPSPANIIPAPVPHPAPHPAAGTAVRVDVPDFPAPTSPASSSLSPTPSLSLSDFEDADISGTTASVSRTMTPSERDSMLKKRRIRNRQSAKRSRERSRTQTAVLVRENAALRAAIRGLVNEVQILRQRK